MFKKAALFGLIISTSILFSACSKKTDSNITGDAQSNKKLLINALEMSRRPFIVLNPHISNRLITLYLDKVDSEVSSSTIDIEYLAGNLLKGGRVSLNFPLNLPYGQAFLLGSCSTGGKCSFDKDLTSGTIKNRLELGSETHILKTNFIFLDAQASMPDGKVSFEGDKDTGILIDTQGLPSVNGIDSDNLAFNPLAITAVNSNTITGKLKIRAQAGSAVIFDGKKYNSLDMETDGDFAIVSLNHKPWNKNFEIVRDDEKGKTEAATINILGPIVLLK